jgi:hypothetical protein
MKQALHIFRKDIRHLWPELTAYAALLFAFGVVSPQLWDPAALNNTYLQLFSTLLEIILPMSWLFLITRAVHDESLVGDQQFWITRPYRSSSLLIAKLLFVIVCVALPFLVVHAALLLYAGLNPFTAVPGLLVTQLCYILILWLPLSIAAALTATVAQAFLALVAVILLWVSLFAFAYSMMGPRLSPPGVLPVFAVLCGLLLVGTLLYQYATRNTRRTRLAFVAAATTALMLFGATELWNADAPMNFLVHTVYAESASAHLVFDSSVNRIAARRVHSVTTANLVPITLPIQVAGLSSSDRLFEPYLSYTLETSGGRYVAPWRPSNITTNGLGLLIPQRVLQLAGMGNVKLHLSLAVTRLTPGATQTIVATRRFRIPNGGNCELHEDFAGNNTVCRYPFENVTPTLVTATVVSGSCREPGTAHEGTATLSTIPASTREDPVVQIPLYLGGSVCPGTKLTMVPYQRAGNLRLELDANPVDLSSFRDE